jgi:hypothetical protein
MTTPASGLCDKLVPITSALCLNSAEVATVEVDILAILEIDDDIEEYHRELKLIIDLQKEIQVIHTDNTVYARCIGILEGDLQTTNKTIQILQGLITNALTLQAIELPHPPEYSGDRMELLNFISKVRSKLAGENGCFSDNQHKLYYIYGYLKGNGQKYIQPYIQTDKMSFEDIEA